jgi:hypothetical protein
MAVLVWCAISKTRSNSGLVDVIFPFTKMYSLPVFQMEQFGSKPTSLPIGDTSVCKVPVNVLLLPKKPELTTTGLSDKTKAPIILELLEV